MLPEQFVINWNLRFPLDRWWRTKHKVAFNSEEHRRTNQIDIMYEFLEEKLYNQAIELDVMNKKKLEEYEKGKWIKDQPVNSKQEEELFNKLAANFKLS